MDNPNPNSAIVFDWILDFYNEHLHDALKIYFLHWARYSCELFSPHSKCHWPDYIILDLITRHFLTKFSSGINYTLVILSATTALSRWLRRSYSGGHSHGRHHMCHTRLRHRGRVRCVHRLKTSHWKVRRGPCRDTRKGHDRHLGHDRGHLCIGELRGYVLVVWQESLLLDQLVLVHFQLILLCLDLTLKLLLLFLKLNPRRIIRTWSINTDSQGLKG